jgi:hypothetical protein
MSVCALSPGRDTIIDANAQDVVFDYYSFHFNLI